MKRFLLKHSFNIVYYLFVTSFLLVVFVRDSLDNELLVLTINYTFWYSFGLASGVFLSSIINKKYSGSGSRPKQ
ncbi:MAG: hypothetical protein JZU53_04285 [Paludibacter sp.]|nr:hypothetical protein [Paludibacter sp.]